MDIKVKENFIKMLLWKEVFSIPLCIILFNKFRIVFWLYIMIDRLIVLFIISKSIKIDEVFEEAFINVDHKFLNLAIFSVITSITLYIITFIKNRQLFYILIICEISDYIVTKLLEKY